MPRTHGHGLTSIIDGNVEVLIARAGASHVETARTCRVVALHLVESFGLGLGPGRVAKETYSCGKRDLLRPERVVCWHSFTLEGTYRSIARGLLAFAEAAFQALARDRDMAYLHLVSRLGVE